MADLTASEDDKPPEFVIIEEIYEHVDAQDDFELELERALDSEAKIVVIEPAKLGGETSYWIKAGNCLHKTAVVSGVSSLVAGTVWPNKEAVILPLGFLSVVCAGVYAVSWQFDPCCKYQIEYDLSVLKKLPFYNLTSTTPVVLVRKDDKWRKLFHNLASVAAGSLCAWKVYKWYMN